MLPAFPFLLCGLLLLYSCVCLSFLLGLCKVARVSDERIGVSEAPILV
jgi:hypothetical protein